MQDLEHAWFQERATGDLMAVLNDDVNQLERFLDIGANEIIQVLTPVVAVGAICFVLDPSVAMLAIAPMPVILWGSFWFQRRLEPRYEAVRNQAGSLNGQLANNLLGISTVKSFTAEDREAAADGSGTLTVGQYSVLLFLSQRLLWPLTRLGETFDQYQRAMASTNRILDVVDTEPTITSGPERLALQPGTGEERFEDVTFAYEPGATPALDGVSLTLEAGRTTAVVGPTGSGKSTLMRLLLRFYDVEHGRVSIEGHDVRDLDLVDLRHLTGLVGQDVYLFHGTVRENIAYGRPDAPFEDVVAAATVAEIHDFARRVRLAVGRADRSCRPPRTGPRPERQRGASVVKVGTTPTAS